MAFQTTLQRLYGVDSDSFGPGEYDKLVDALRNGEQVTVTCRAVVVDGGYTDYYDVVLADGTEIAALSGYHLVNIDQFVDKEWVGAVEDDDDADPGEMDGDAASALASAGWGTDEDYEHGSHYEGDF